MTVERFSIRHAYSYPFRGEYISSLFRGFWGFGGWKFYFLGVHCSNSPNSPVSPWCKYGSTDRTPIRFPYFPVVCDSGRRKLVAPISPNSPFELGESTEKPLKAQGFNHFVWSCILKVQGRILLWGFKLARNTPGSPGLFHYDLGKSAKSG